MWPISAILAIFEFCDKNQGTSKYSNMLGKITRRETTATRRGAELSLLLVKGEEMVFTVLFNGTRGPYLRIYNTGMRRKIPDAGHRSNRSQEKMSVPGTATDAAALQNNSPRRKNAPPFAGCGTTGSCSVVIVSALFLFSLHPRFSSDLSEGPHFESASFATRKICISLHFYRGARAGEDALGCRSMEYRGDG